MEQSYLINFVRRCVCLTVFLLWEFALSANILNTPVSENGILDLQEWNFQKDHIAEIGGNVKFYWNNFVTIDDIKNKKKDYCIISLTSSWNNQKDKSCKFPANGFASYNLKIKIPEKDIGKQFILRSHHFIAYASEIFVNNQMVCNNGSVGRSKNDVSYKPSRNTISRPFVADSSVLEVVIWVSNYSHFRGGIFHKLNLGYADDMIKHRERAITYDLIVIISLLIMFLYHFIIYFVNTKETASLFFSLTCMVFAFDLSFQDTMSFFLVFPNASFGFTSLLHLSLPYMIPSTFIFFLYALFPNESSKNVRNITGFITIVLVFITILNIPDIFSQIVKPHYAYALIIVFYIYYIAIKAVINKREGAKLFLIAYLIFSVCAINDILFVFEIIYTTNMVSSGLIVFVFLLSILQGRRTAQMSKRNIKLTKYLKEVNADLGIKVEKRTKELNLSLAKLQKLTEFKEDMTNMIIHDLKTPLSTIINAEFLSNDKIGYSLIQHSGYTMLHLVENVLDVYKYKNTEVELNKKQVELIQVINVAIKELEFIAKQKLIKIKINENIKFIINVDEDLLKRVLVNLLTNAVKFSPRNETIDIDAKVNDDDEVRISVNNKGPAIPKEEQEIIFEIFGQADQKNKQGSTGLGLTFCKLAIEAHKGKIGVISESDVGVEFWFTLPDCFIEEGEITPNLLIEKNHIRFTKEELDILKPIINELKRFEVYQISEINKILRKIKHSSIRVKEWTEVLEQIVYEGNSKLYKSFLNQ